MPLTPEQRERVLDAISTGRLPLIPPRKMYAGYGSGRACNGCDQEISAKEIEYEADYEGDRTYYLHLGCAALWEVGRHRCTTVTDENANAVLDHSQAARETALDIAKRNAQVRDHADVLARESEAAIEKARQVKRGEHPGE